MQKKSQALAWGIGLAALMSGGCASVLPTGPPLPVQRALPATGETTLDRYFSPTSVGQSRFLVVGDHDQALRQRLALVNAAQRSIDAQYYLWHGDDTGVLLLDALLRAAQRGVRVRLLLDDFFPGIQRGALAAARGLPNFHVRVFNPFRSRSQSVVSRIPELLARLSTLNVRMHNKTFVVDNHVAIVGGRNIGDPYFAVRDAGFRDMDLLIAGLAAERLSAAFDRYWNSSAMVDGGKLLPADGTAVSRASIRRRADQVRRQDSRWQSTGLDYLKTLSRQMVNGRSRVLFDSPPGGPQGVSRSVAGELYRLMAGARSDLVVVSGYLVPDRELLDLFSELTNRGVRVRVLTNSMMSNDLGFVHTGYRRHRWGLLKSGVELYEWRGGNRGTVTLHTKAIVVDEEFTFVGSYNLDPRSRWINYENGIVVRSVAVARQTLRIIRRDLRPDASWRVIDDDGVMKYFSSDGVQHIQPARNFVQRMKDMLYALIPVEDQI